MSTFRKGDRVRYQVRYNDGQGMGEAHVVKRPAYGRVTSLRDHPRRGVIARIAVERPRDGEARYVERSVADIEPDGTWFRTGPSRVSGASLTADMLDGGAVRASISYPVSIGGTRTEQRAIGVVLDRDTAAALAAFLAGQLGYAPADCLPLNSPEQVAADERAADYEYAY